MDLNDLAIELFCQFDPEKKGYITKDELLNVSNREGPFSEVQVLSIFSLLDKDDKGVITLTDFTDAFLDISDINEMSESDTIENDKILYKNEEEYITDNNDSKYIPDNCDEYIDDNVTDFISENNYINANEHEYLNGNVRAYSSDEEVSDDHSDDIGTDNRYMDYQHYDSTNNDLHVNNYSEYESIKNDQNKCRTSSVNDDWFLKSRNLDDKQKSEFEDQYWWEYGNSINGFRINSAFFKRESLPSLKSTDIPRINDLKLSRKWKSCEAGINKCFIASNNKAFQLDRTNSLNTTHTRKRNLIKKLSNLKLNQLEQEYKKEKLVTKELDCIFGPKHQVVTRAASCTCLELDDQNQTNRTKKCMSQNNLNMYPTTNKKVINRYNTILRTRSYRELDIDEKQDYLYRTADSIENINKYFKRRRSSSTPSENLSSINAEDGLYVSCESVLSPRENTNEDWQSYLKRMQCVSLFGGNQSLRFIWQQIGSYQKELLIPLEDFLKSVVEEHKSVYTKCQDVENTLHMKIEQHEKEIDQLYEEFDRTTQRELDQIEKKHHEREEAIKTEYRKILEQKEQVHQDNLRHTNEMSGRLNNYEAELGDLREDKKKLEDHLRQVVQEQQIIISESEQIVNENEVLKEKLTTCNGNIREIQDYLNQVTKDYEKEKVRHGTIMRRFKDLLEEKEFLEISLTAIATENEDLRNANKTHEENLDSSLILNNSKDGDLTSKVPPAMCSSPVADKKQPILPHGLSLHEEMNALDFEVEMDALDHNNLLDNTYAEQSIENSLNLKTELHIQDNEKQPGYKIIITDEYKNNNNHDLSTTRVFSPLEEIELPETEREEEDDLLLSSSLDDSDALDESINNMVTSTPTKSMGIRFASAVQSEFKVILCGDAAVGKTNLIHRICFNKFSKKREITTQMDSYKKIVELDSSTIILNLWDTCGQERYNSLPRSYYRKIDVAILVYDISDEVSFVNAKSWFKAIHDYTHENVLIILIGNKVDLNHRRRVTYAQGESLAVENDAIFVEASAKSAENISSIITLIARTLLAQHEYVFIHNYFERTNILHDDKRLIEMKSRCC